MELKYKLTKNTKKFGVTTLYQIQATKSFSNIKKGELGGWIQKRDNLSHTGNAWVSGDARVSGNAWVSDILCSKFSFTSPLQIQKWYELEKQFRDFCNV